MEEQSGGLYEGEREGRFASSKETVLEQGELEGLLSWSPPEREFPEGVRRHSYSYR